MHFLIPRLTTTMTSFIKYRALFVIIRRIFGFSGKELVPVIGVYYEIPEYKIHATFIVIHD